MPRSLVSRFLALAVAVATLVVAPVSALAHGYAHHEAAEHGGAAHHEDDGVHSARTSNGGFAIDAIDHQGGDHPHATVSVALLKKSLSPLVAIVALRVFVPRAAVVEVTPPQASVTCEPRASMAHAPPPALRGPPAVIG